MLGVRLWLLVATGWGLLVMRRLMLRGRRLDFPIVPPSLVWLTSFFLLACFATTLWITGDLLIGENALCNQENNKPVGLLTPWERTIFGTSLVYSLSCCLWIISMGTKGYRHGPKVDSSVLDAIVAGMAQNESVDLHEGEG